ncbi:Alpha/Beta hydrolase protein [Limtongia smithiae]|uniref:Alpha/Beta hydrolase protein n=1 Tax=Limtongia smithiae TaxID=1125753 RepID=UPI0034CDEF25
MAPTPCYVRVTEEPENPFFSVVQGQKVAIIPEFTLESGMVIRNFPVAYKTWGKLNAECNNVMVICHALTGSADVSDWWGPLIGPGKAFDISRFFIICLNSLGSPYGSASPCTLNGETGKMYGPEFPLVTVRDDVNIHKLILDDLGIAQIAVCIGGSMGGMLVLEYAFFGPSYVRSIVPLATSSRHSAWCISWGEAQRQCIYSDPKYADGYYTFDDPPNSGLGAARMSALLTYRSRDSFETKFSRNVPDPSRHRTINAPQRAPETVSEENWAVHNEGFKNGKKLASVSRETTPTPGEATSAVAASSVSSSPAGGSPLTHVSSSSSLQGNRRPQTFFTAQSYLRYQGDKFVKRFDANCYIAITRKLDTHDISRDRGDDVRHALTTLTQPALVIGIESDGLFTFAEQQEIATYMPNARLAKINSPEGHDAFLLEFAEVNRLIVNFLEETLPDIMSREGAQILSDAEELEDVKYNSTVGEVEDLTTW